MPTDDVDLLSPIVSELVQEDASYADIVVQFVDALPERLEIMRQALEAADFEALRKAAHQLKGSGGGYGYPVLTAKAADLEKQAKSESLEDCTRRVDELKELLKRVAVGAS